MPRRIYVYVAGAYTPRSNEINHAVETLVNINEALNVGVKLLKLGCVPYIPHFDSLLYLVGGKEMLSHDFYNYSAAWLEKCDAMVLLPGWGDSEGVQAEIRLAHTLDIPVFTSIKALVYRLPELEGEV